MLFAPMVFIVLRGVGGGEGAFLQTQQTVYSRFGYMVSWTM